MTKINGTEMIEVTAIGGPLVFNTRGFRAACDKFLIGRGVEMRDIGGRDRGRKRSTLNFQRSTNGNGEVYL